MTCENYTNNGIPVGIGYDDKDRARSLMELSSVNVTTISATTYYGLPASSSGGVSSLEELSDICITKPIGANEILVYNSASSCWGNSAVTDVITPVTNFVELTDVSAGLTLANHPGEIITVGGNAQLGVSTVAAVNADYVTTAGNTHLSALVTSIEASTVGISGESNSHFNDTTIHFTSGALGLAAMAFQANLVFPDNYTNADGYSEGANNGDLVTVNGDADNLSLIPSSTFTLASELGALGSKDTVESGDMASNSVTTAAITASSVTLSKMEAMATHTIMGNDDSGTAHPQHLTMAEVRTILKPVMVRPFHSAADSSVSHTTHPSTARFLSNSNRNIQLVDLSDYSQVRYSHRTVTNSASVNNPRLVLKYSTTYTQVAASYSDMASTEVSGSLASYNIQSSGWLDLVAGAKADDIYITVLEVGGDGALTPRTGSIMAEFR